MRCGGIYLAWNMFVLRQVSHNFSGHWKAIHMCVFLCFFFVFLCLLFPDLWLLSGVARNAYFYYYFLLKCFCLYLPSFSCVAWFEYLDRILAIQTFWVQWWLTILGSLCWTWKNMDLFPEIKHRSAVFSSDVCVCPLSLSTSVLLARTISVECCVT